MPTFTAPARFAGLSLYAVLGVDATATTDAIKRGYRRAALKYHPDHNHSPTANEEFAYLAHAHEILSHPTTRATYDSTGAHDAAEAAQSEGGGGEASVEYWRSVFPRVTAEDIEAFRVKYVGSEEEVEDVKAAYERYEGNVQNVLDSIPFAEASSVPRLCALLNEHCGARITAAQQKRLAKKAEQWQRDEQAEFEQLALTGSSEEKQAVQAAGDMTQLVAMLARKKEENKAKQDAWLDQLADKYGGGGTGGKGKGKGKDSKAAAPAGKRKAGKRDASAADEETKQQAGEEDEEEKKSGARDDPLSDGEFDRIQAEMLKRREANKASAATSSVGDKKGKNAAQPDKKRRKTNK